MLTWITPQRYMLQALRTKYGLNFKKLLLALKTVIDQSLIFRSGTSSCPLLESSSPPQPLHSHFSSSFSMRLHGHASVQFAPALYDTLVLTCAVKCTHMYKLRVYLSCNIKELVKTHFLTSTAVSLGVSPSQTQVKSHSQVIF